MEFTCITLITIITKIRHSSKLTNKYSKQTLQQLLNLLTQYSWDGQIIKNITKYFTDKMNLRKLNITWTQIKQKFYHILFKDRICWIRWLLSEKWLNPEIQRSWWNLLKKISHYSTSREFNKLFKMKVCIVSIFSQMKAILMSLLKIKEDCLIWSIILNYLQSTAIILVLRKSRTAAESQILINS